MFKSRAFPPNLQRMAVPPAAAVIRPYACSGLVCTATAKNNKKTTTTQHYCTQLPEQPVNNP